ncbi:DoxX family protein [Paludibacter sp. 221]|uniref:BT_3928 family protein n=1 Tax=Paludibacter sp. 221 TaxID=2302939 RepID=UPI0013D2E95C|nr:BT_3928 family protein [Paludibacter sp. 221]NDV46305.1 DoxX family protein [Paludibacter sp. 221]
MRRTHRYNTKYRTKNPPLSKTTSTILTIIRVIFGAVFTFSGFVKVIDPLGSAYKIQDYLIAFGESFGTTLFDAFIPLALVLGIIQSVLELIIGLNLIFKIRFRLTVVLALLFMLVMTPLTLYIAIANPVSDCGCFGDALVISNTATFIKNVFLLAIIITLFIYRKKIHPVFTPATEWLVLLLFVVAGTWLSVHSYRHLPMFDFRSYKVGVNIPEAMEIPDGYPQDVYETTFVYEKDGVKKDFTHNDYPKNDSTWVFVEQKTTLVSKGYEPPIHDFTIEDEYFEDITEDVLSYEGYTYLVIAYDINSAPQKELIKVQRLYNKAVLSADTKVYVLTASSDDDIEVLRGNTGITYPFYKTDPITLKTIVRANPGIVLLENGTIKGKWHWRDFEWE